MAKTAPAKPPATPPSPRVLLAYRLAKLVAIVVGLPATVLCLMAVVGALTDNGYARLLGAVVVTVAVPLGLADRLLPSDDAKRAPGLVTDVCALFWLALPVLLAGAGNGATRPLLAREGDRLALAGYAELAQGAYLLAWVEPVAAPPASPPSAGSASAGGPLTSASAPAGDAGAPAGSASAPAASASQLPAPPPAPDAGAAHGKQDRTPAELFKELAPSVVTIFAHMPAGDASGTGFVITADGTVVTNHHVIADARALRIKFESGTTYEAVELLTDDATADLALLHIDLAAPLDGGVKEAPAPVALGDSDAVVVGERAIAIGNPLGLEHTLTDGLVSSRRLYMSRQWIQMSVPISPGNSGGPLFDLRGEVIGITTATITGYGVAQNLNLAVPVNELKKLFRPTYPGRHKIGDGSAPSKW